jgi:GYF domain 2
MAASLDPQNLTRSAMAESWTISVGGRVYGPYSLEQMQGFHAENRLADHSLVARAGEEQFHPASEDSELALLFQPAVAVEAEASAEPAQPHRFGAKSEAETPSEGPSHFVIVADMKSRSIAGLEEEIFTLGQAHRFGPQSWVLSSEATINTIRNALVQKLGKIDTLFIVDAAHDKAAWFNFGPETDTRIRKMWSRPVEHQGTEKRSVKRA